MSLITPFTLSNFETPYETNLRDEEKQDYVNMLLLGILIEPIPLPQPHIPSLRFNINELENVDCINLFRFTKVQMYSIVENLNLPSIIITSGRCRALSIEALCIFLRKMSYPTRYFDMIRTFGRSRTALSLIFNYMLNHIYRCFHHLLKFDSNRINEQKLATYSRAISLKGSPLINCVGFIDGTVRPICRPILHQKECYNGHKV